MVSDPIYAIYAANDGTGLSGGMLRDGFKLAGGRYNLLDLLACSTFGCRQNGPGSIFSIGYGAGGFVDMVLESFAGPHDSANAHWWYDRQGNIKNLSGMQATFLDLTTNYTTSLIFAAPFAIAAIREQTLNSSYSYVKKR